MLHNNAMQGKFKRKTDIVKYRKYQFMAETELIFNILDETLNSI